MPFLFFEDSNLTQTLSQITAQQQNDNSLPPVDKQVWFGSDNAAVKVQANSNPGTDNITISIVDTLPAGGEPTTAFKLATTQSGLAGATAGAPLTVGTQVLGGISNAFTFWVRIDDQTLVAGSYPDCRLQMNQIVEGAV